MDFERLTTAIMSRRDFGQRLDEVHDDFVPRLCSEEMFYLAWHASSMLSEDNDASLPRPATA